MRFSSFAILAAYSAAIHEICWSDLKVQLDGGEAVELVLSDDRKSGASKGGSHVFTIDHRENGADAVFKKLVAFHSTAGGNHEGLFGKRWTPTKCSEDLLIVEIPQQSPWTKISDEMNRECPQSSDPLTIYHKLEEMGSPGEFFTLRRFHEAAKLDPKLKTIVGEFLGPLAGISDSCNARIAAVKYSSVGKPLSEYKFNKKSQKGSDNRGEIFVKIAGALVKAIQLIHSHGILLTVKGLKPEDIFVHSSGHAEFRNLAFAKPIGDVSGPGTELLSVLSNVRDMLERTHPAADGLTKFIDENKSAIEREGWSEKRTVDGSPNYEGLTDVEKAWQAFLATLSPPAPAVNKVSVAVPVSSAGAPLSPAELFDAIEAKRNDLEREFPVLTKQQKKRHKEYCSLPKNFKLVDVEDECQHVDALVTCGSREFRSYTQSETSVNVVTWNALESVLRQQVELVNFIKPVTRYENDTRDPKCLTIFSETEPEGTLAFRRIITNGQSSEIASFKRAAASYLEMLKKFHEFALVGMDPSSAVFDTTNQHAVQIGDMSSMKSVADSSDEKALVAAAAAAKKKDLETLARVIGEEFGKNKGARPKWSSAFSAATSAGSFDYDEWIQKFRE